MHRKYVAGDRRVLHSKSSLQGPCGRHYADAPQAVMMAQHTDPQAATIAPRESTEAPQDAPCSSAPAALRSPATKQRARPHRCHREVARGQVSVIVEHTDDDCCED